MKDFVFVTGMFRSGTTLLARMLHAHPHIAFASDAYQPTLKAFRNNVAAQLFDEDQVDPEAPLDDYYFYPDKQALMVQIQKTSLDLPIENLSLPLLRKQTASYSREFSPKLELFLDQMKGQTYADLITTGIEVIERAYANQDTTLVGFKTTWSDEFATHLLRHFPQTKAIHIVRDPRGVCASKTVHDNSKYPLLFLIRQWRKLVTFAWRDTQSTAPYYDRVLLIRYEDLVANPKQEAERICAFLDVDFSSRMVEAESFVDGDDKPWIQNTSYSNGKRAFNQESIDKWRRVLTQKQVEFIERLCFAEMISFGYSLTEANECAIPPSMVFDPPELPKADLAEWIRPYAQLDPKILLREMALEHWRSTILTDSCPVSDDVKQALCLDIDFFDEVRRLVKG